MERKEVYVISVKNYYLMTALEFDVLDELYFVVSFRHLQEELEMEEQTLKEALLALLQKGWVKCFKDASEEAMQHETEFEIKYKEYFYLASKKGLLAHNGRV
ncbi:transporter [Catalinimonas niigatensis]|uniref:transporter n=1 Tax=Catalinimonas niigatensis TaxID=1397264 RepID=UPI0026660D98|nr:transporter [Catalinimonas niigatensis]WPP48888.1 transporter [Catalinimonas niigatensis]